MATIDEYQDALRRLHKLQEKIRKEIEGALEQYREQSKVMNTLFEHLSDLYDEREKTNCLAKGYVNLITTYKQE